jgi:DNA-binding beta-propeller fold protein YncE
MAALTVSVAAQSPTFHVSKVNIGGEGGTDYLTADPSAGRLFVSRQTHVMVLESGTGHTLGDIPDTPGNHGIALAPASNHGFVTDGGDSTVTMFDLKTLETLKKIPVPVGGLDGIMYDAALDRIILTNHSKPIGTLVALDPADGRITGNVQLTNSGPEGAAADANGRIFVNLEGSNAIDVVDAKRMKVVATWPIPDCNGPTGIAYDSSSNRIFSGCSGTSVVVDAATGAVVAKISNGRGVDALAWDPREKLLYIPAGKDGNVTIVHQEDPDHYSVVATVPTQIGAKTITVDTTTHTAYLFAVEYGPVAVTSTESAPPPPAGSRPIRGRVIGASLLSVRH